MWGKGNKKKKHKKKRERSEADRQTENRKQTNRKQKTLGFSRFIYKTMLRVELSEAFN